MLSQQPLYLPPGLTQPRQATARNYDYATYGGHAAAIAAMRGRPLIPWQRYAADVGLEVDAHGIFRYAIVVVTVQRQAGKTDLDQSVGLQNALMGPNRFVWNTAQTGQDASGKWRELAEAFDEAPILRQLAHKGSKGLRFSNGSEAITLLNGSKLRPHPPSQEALHGKQSDRNTIDEAWAFTSAQGAALRQAIGPTTTTRRMVTGQRPQLWIISTEGTVESTFFNPLLDQCRAGDPDVAFLDWGLRDDDDPTDLEVVASRHPGYGHLLDMATLRDQANLFRDAPGEFARAFGNRRTGASERLIPVDAWLDAAWRDDELPKGRPAIGAAVGIDDQDATIAVAIERAGPDAPVVSAIVNDGHQAGTSWAIGRLVDISARQGNPPLVIDRRGPSAGLYDAAKRAKLNLLDIDSQGVASAHSSMLAGVTNPAGPSWRYRPHPALDAAADLATRRYFADGAWVLGRRASVGSISAIEAPALAAWGADHLPADVGMQLF